jgi:hypothetical protein
VQKSRKLLTELQDMAQCHFREVCGVAHGDPWSAPDSITVCVQEGSNMPYYTPKFELGVKAKVNVNIFKKVADLTMDEIVS